MRFHGTLEEVSTGLGSYDNAGYPLPAWADVQVHSELSQLEVADALLKVIEALDRHQLVVLARRHLRLVALRPLGDSDETETILTRSLHDFTAREVFEQRLEAEPAEARAELLRTFDELLEGL